MVEMDLLGVRLELPNNLPVLLLQEQSGERRVLPIYIGTEEARSIAQALDGVVTPRPMTHDLMRDVLVALGASISRIVVTELREQTFHAEVELVLDGRVHRLSSRPSDAVALAVRLAATIYAEEAVLDEAGRPVEEEVEDEIVDEFKAFIEQVNPEDFR